MMKRVRVLVAVTLGVVLGGIWIWYRVSQVHPPSDGAVFMPDTALSTEAHFIRHRSLTDLVEVFAQGPGLLPYFASDYTYAPAPYLHANGAIR